MYTKSQVHAFSPLYSNSRILTETDPEKFFRFFMERVLKKEDGSKWNDEELKLLHEL